MIRLFTIVALLAFSSASFSQQTYTLEKSESQSRPDTAPSEDLPGQGGGGGRSCQTSCFIKKI